MVDLQKLLSDAVNNIEQAVPGSFVVIIMVPDASTGQICFVGNAPPELSDAMMSDILARAPSRGTKH